MGALGGRPKVFGMVKLLGPGEVRPLLEDQDALGIVFDAKELQCGLTKLLAKRVEFQEDRLPVVKVLDAEANHLVRHGGVFLGAGRSWAALTLRA